MFDQVVHGAHGEAAAHDGFELVAGLQFAAQVTVFGAHLARFERLFRGDHELVGIERFGDVVKRPQLDGFHGRRDLGEAGHDDDFRIRLQILHGAQKRHAIQARHLDVDQDQLVRMFAGHLEPLLRVLGRADLMTLLGEQQGTTLAHDLLVIDNQDRRVLHVDLTAVILMDERLPSHPGES